jgi:MtN3 and saliva related transmembrane protein
MESLKLEIIGYTAGFLTTVCLVPQLWKILITKSVKDVSVWTYFVLLSGQILWIVYGTCNKCHFLFISNNIVLLQLR